MKKNPWFKRRLFGLNKKLHGLNKKLMVQDKFQGLDNKPNNSGDIL